MIAPHSDDEAIGCAGVMLNALQDGKRCGVVVVGNGDGFPRATAALTHKTVDQLTPADYIALGGVRQQHSIDAMAFLGLRADDLIFLCYPEDMLSAVYLAEGDIPVRSKFTQKTATFGVVVPDYHSRVHGRPAPYVKASLVGDLVEIIKARKPKEIYVTSELDPNFPGDHHAVFCFVRDAVRAAGWHGTLWTYLVHGLDTVSPPPPVRRLVLSAEQIEKKRALIKIYQSKVSPVHDYLSEKYSRPEELFWPVRIE